MNVHIEKDWIRRTVKVWVYEPGLRGVGTLWQRAGDNWTRIHVHEGETPLTAPTFDMPQEMFEAIVKEGSGLVPPSDATHAALTDTKAVRDRLLSLVGAAWEGRQS